MKTSTSGPSIVRMKRVQLEQLTTEVKETLATEFVALDKKGQKTFTAADLWNIHKQRRYRVQRRSY